MKIIGISAYYHDSAAALIINGKVVFAIEEERLSGIKHDNSFPVMAVNKCLEYADLKISDVDEVCYYERPLLKFERILESIVGNFPRSWGIFVDAMPEWLGEKIIIEKQIRKKLKFNGKITFSKHHLSHAAAAFFTSGFKRAAIITIDGVGEYQTTVIWKSENGRIIPIQEINYPNSIGLLFSTFTSFLGFEVNEGEYKLMGLASYGKPRYVQDVLKTVKILDKGSFELEMKYFSFETKKQMWSEHFENIFGGPKQKEDKYTQYHKDLAASIQSVTEKLVLRIVNYTYEITKEKNLCFGGGVGLNAVVNGKIIKKSRFSNLYIFGPSGDSGCAIGSALVANQNRNTNVKFKKTNLLLGTSYTDEEIERSLINFKVTYKKMTEREKIDFTARELSKGKIVGWFQGRMEFGPRALGNRSILSAPFPREQRNKVNKIKIREEFRPFAGIVLENKVKDFFEDSNGVDLSMMNICLRVKNGMAAKIPAVTHIDRSCRVQTVKVENDQVFKLLDKFYKLTKVPILLNTSFNLKNQPIVEAPKQAVEVFLKTKIDVLIIGPFVLSK